VPEKSRRGDRPGHRGGVERQRLFDFIEQFEGVAALAGPSCDEVMIGMSRSRQTSNSFACVPRCPGRVDHHDRGIHRGQRAIGVLGKVLMARRVQEVEHQPSNSKVITE